MLDYEKRLIEYQRNIEKSKEPSFVRYKQKECVIHELKKTKNAKKLSRDVSKGKYEEFFLLHLQKYFPNKIYTNMELGHFQNPFVPDFVYIGDNNMYIDIEIDEPYISNVGTPIHYIDSDNNRDSYFLENNWIVIRFAEEQIVKYPNECCKYIYEYTGYVMRERDTPPTGVPSVNRWSDQQAIDMANKNYRNTYSI